MTRHVCSYLWVAFVLTATLSAQDSDWRYSGTLYLSTTPEGANLPASAAEADFPALVRLHEDFFDFRQAQPKGEDIRFFAADKPLAHRIEAWDAEEGSAAIWVRVPVIKGNSRQELTLRWGNPAAKDASDGAAVFNASNGYVGVWHFGDSADPAKDDAGTLSAVDAGTTACEGVVGRGRHFEPGKGIKCGQIIAALPMGAEPHTSEAWFRAERANATVLAWGNEEAQGKVVMQFVSPPHVNMDCYFSGGNVAGRSRLSLAQWVHVAHTYRNGDTRLYVNGVLDGTNSGGPALAIKRPAKMWIGGWYDDYHFAGDIDDVRISKVVRSPDWIKLQYENQKPLQTLAGMLVRSGDAFSVSPAAVELAESARATVRAQVGGAEKIYWILVRDGAETVIAVDRLACTVAAGRVTGDTSYVLRLKAVVAGEVKILNVPVTIKEDIPEPSFTLQCPPVWNGRDRIEVVPVIANLAALQAKGAGRLDHTWSVAGGATLNEAGPGKLILTRSQTSGTLTVTLTLDNGGAKVAASATIKVTEPSSDPWVERIPEKDEKPEENQFYARDDRNEGTLYWNGTLREAADTVFLRVYADGAQYKTESRAPAADGGFAFAVKLVPGLVKYRAELGTRTSGTEKVLEFVGNLVCGDAFLIDGQSNALATDTGEQSPPETSEWVRSYGSPGDDPRGPRANLWCCPVWKAQRGEKAELGYWGMELAKSLVARQKVPIFIVNGAVGGTRIDQHQRSESDPADVTTIYGRMLWRVRQARLTHGIRAILWHQGENNQGAASPTGDYDWKSYEQCFVAMSAGWKRDYPNVQHYYVFQIWPNACSMGGSSGAGDMLREVQRTLPRLYSNLSIMSTLGITPPGGCHYPLAGWAEFAHLIQPLMERDLYGASFDRSITPPDLLQAYYASETRDRIVLEFDQPVVWADALAREFYLDGAGGEVASGAAAGNMLTLALKKPSAAGAITYLEDASWNHESILRGANGIAALTFCQVPILRAPADALGGGRR